jgi:hypothetical protein
MSTRAILVDHPGLDKLNFKKYVGFFLKKVQNCKFLIFFTEYEKSIIYVFIFVGTDL